MCRGGGVRSPSVAVTKTLPRTNNCSDVIIIIIIIIIIIQNIYKAHKSAKKNAHGTYRANIIIKTKATYMYIHVHTCSSKQDEKQLFFLMSVIQI